MSGGNKNEYCSLCKDGELKVENTQLVFRQLTDKGYVLCRVTISIDVCTLCGLKTCGDLAEAIIEDAVRQEYDKLP
jgi:hypothetical protein